MEEISVKGEKYLKASVIAENFGYTQDYIGQLCRSGQVKATLVGRSWYVNENSVREHRKGRYRSTSSKSKEYLREAVEEKSVSSLEKRVTNSGAKYENDESDLIPTIKINRIREENTNENKVISDEKSDIAEISEVEVKKADLVANERPVFKTVFKTIPNYKTGDIHIAPRKTASVAKIQEKIVEKKQKPSQFSFLAAAGITSCFLLVTGALAFGALGLEKRLVVGEGQQAMVLYGFDAKVVFENFKNIKF